MSERENTEDRQREAEHKEVKKTKDGDNFKQMGEKGHMRERERAASCDAFSGKHGGSR